MDQLAETVKRTVRWYASGAANARTFALNNEEEKTYAVLIVITPNRLFPPSIVVLARVEHDKVIIEEDLTDRPLVDALIEAGISREQIVLANAGEKLEEPQTPVT